MQLEFNFTKTINKKISSPEKFSKFMAPLIKEILSRNPVAPNTIYFQMPDFDEKYSFPTCFRIDPADQYVFDFLEKIDETGLSGIEICHTFLPKKVDFLTKSV